MTRRNNLGDIDQELLEEILQIALKKKKGVEPGENEFNLKQDIIDQLVVSTKNSMNNDQLVAYLAEKEYERQISKALKTELDPTISCNQVLINCIEIHKLNNTSIIAKETILLLPDEYQNKSFGELFGNKNEDAINKLNIDFEALKNMYGRWIVNTQVPVMEVPFLIPAGEVLFQKIELEKEKWMNLLKTNNKNLFTKKLNEVKHQHPLFCDMMAVIMKGSAHKLLHQEPIYKNKQHADYAVIKAGQPNMPKYCMFVIELQLGGEKIDNEHLGKVLMYNDMMMECNPKREFIVSVVTNFNDMILFVTRRNKKGMLRQYSVEMSFWNEGFRYLKYMLDCPDLAVGYETSSDFYFKLSDNAEYFPSKYIGEGQSAHVYHFEKLNDDRTAYTPSNMVVKIFKEDANYQKEKLLFKSLRENKIDSKYIIKEVVIDDKDDKHKAIVLTPLGRPLRDERNLTKRHVSEMFLCVREMHNFGFIHRDLSPSHFYITNEIDGPGHVFLIDLGSAITMPQNKKLNESDLKTSKKSSYAGSLQYAANEILERIEDYQPDRRHDLESLVKTLFCVFHRIEVPIFDNQPKNDNESVEDKIKRQNLLFHKTKMWWKYIDNLMTNKNGFEFWLDAFKIVRRTTSDTNIFEVLEEHFMNNFIFFDTEITKDDFENYFNKKNNEQPMVID